MAMTIKEIITLFSEVCDDAAAFARLSIRLPDRPTNDTVPNLKHEAMESAKKACENAETQALIIPILTGAMKHVAKLYAVSLEELLCGEFEPRRHRYEKLMEELQNSKIALEWDTTYEKIAEIIKRTGITPDEELLRNMPRVAEIMLGAFSFFNQYHTNVIKVADGEPSGDKVVFFHSMPRFSSIGEFYGHFRSVPANNAVMLAMVTPTYTQTIDPVNAWKKTVVEQYETRYDSNWSGDERIRNMSRSNSDFDPDTEVDKYRCKAVTGVKRGENIWLIIHEDESSQNGSFLNYHGKRTSFMPFQVLFQEAPQPNAECTGLALPQKDFWNLPSILDAEQALWLPTFYWLLERRFYSQPVDREEPVAILSEMVRVAGKADNPNLPAVTKRLEIAVDPFSVPDNCRTAPECLEFIKHLNITETDIAGAVISPQTPYGSEDMYRSEMWVRSREALAFVAKQKLARDYHENHRDLNSFLVERIEDNKVFLLGELQNPDALIHHLSEHIIDNQPSVVDGQLEMTRGRYPGETVPLIMKTTGGYTRRHHCCQLKELRSR